jgi:hypothetical protein
LRPLLPDLIARWLSQPPSTTEDWEKKVFILSELVEVAEEIWESVLCRSLPPCDALR